MPLTADLYENTPDHGVGAPNVAEGAESQPQPKGSNPMPKSVDHSTDIVQLDAELTPEEEFADYMKEEHPQVKKDSANWNLIKRGYDQENVIEGDSLFDLACKVWHTVTGGLSLPGWATKAGTDAAEFLRRAERGLGVAIREGQERGEVRVQGENARFESDLVDQVNKKVSPTDFAKRAELSGNEGSGRMGIYHLVDDISDDQFEDALDEAKSEGNLSRANVARKAKAKAKHVTLISTRARVPLMNTRAACFEEGGEPRSIRTGCMDVLLKQRPIECFPLVQIARMWNNSEDGDLEFVEESSTNLTLNEAVELAHVLLLMVDVARESAKGDA